MEIVPLAGTMISVAEGRSLSSRKVEVSSVSPMGRGGCGACMTFNIYGVLSSGRSVETQARTCAASVAVGSKLVRIVLPSSSRI